MQQNPPGSKKFSTPTTPETLHMFKSVQTKSSNTQLYCLYEKHQTARESENENSIPQKKGTQLLQRSNIKLVTVIRVTQLS